MRKRAVSSIYEIWGKHPGPTGTPITHVYLCVWVGVGGLYVDNNHEVKCNQNMSPKAIIMETPCLLTDMTTEQQHSKS